MNLPSKLIEDTVKEFSKLPGIGKKTALRLALHLLKQDVKAVEAFGNTVVKMRTDVRFCKSCNNVADQELCSICASAARNKQVVCVVEGMRDVIAIENTNQYTGVYHVLGGVISPLDGIGPDNLHIEGLVDKVKSGAVQELIMALNPTMEGDTTIFYISKQLQGTKVKITSIARGVAFGGELEYVDELTLARSIATRMPYENYLMNR